jgi:hypothetical protein
VIGYDVREELACHPAEFFVRVINAKSVTLIARKNREWPWRRFRRRS